VILKTKEQVQAMKDYLETALGESIGNFTSMVDRDTRREELGRRVFVTTEKSLGVAMDTDVDVIHNLIPMASKSQILQLAGRLRSTGSGLFVSYVDESIEPCAGMGKIVFTTLKKISSSEPSVFSYKGPGRSLTVLTAGGKR
jgi:hypothetical protein